MLEALRKKHERDEEGFTLIELMVVVLIIAILIAIAIPTFLGAQNRARDRAAQSDLRNALTAAKTLATDQEGHFLAADTSGAAGGTHLITPADMESAEASLDYTATLPTGTSTEVAVLTQAAGAGIGLARKSGSGTVFGLFANDQGEVFYCKGISALPTATNCTLTKW